MDALEECPEPWDVWLVDGYNVEPHPHAKFMVLCAHVEREDDHGTYPIMLGFYISSKPRRSLSRSAEKRICQLRMSCEKYEFLEEDSYLNCADVQLYSEGQIFRRLSVVEDADRPRILEAIKKCRLLKERDRQDILAALQMKM